MWNKANLFTGWVDIPLSSKGINEALEGALPVFLTQARKDRRNEDRDSANRQLIGGQRR